MAELMRIEWNRGSTAAVRKNTTRQSNARRKPYPLSRESGM
jgi:hypothetical protein